MIDCRTYAEVISDVESSRADSGVLPVESSVTTANHDHPKTVMAVENLTEVLGRQVIKREIFDYPVTTSRFCIASRVSLAIDSRIPSQVSAFMITEQFPGALAELSQVLREARTNLTKRKSHPILSNSGRELFPSSIYRRLGRVKKLSGGNSSGEAAQPFLSSSEVLTRLSGKCYSALEEALISEKKAMVRSSNHERRRR